MNAIQVFYDNGPNEVKGIIMQCNDAAQTTQRIGKDKIKEGVASIVTRIIMPFTNVPGLNPLNDGRYYDNKTFDLSGGARSLWTVTDFQEPGGKYLKGDRIRALGSTRSEMLGSDWVDSYKREMGCPQGVMVGAKVRRGSSIDGMELKCRNFV